MNDYPTYLRIETKNTLKKEDDYSIYVIKKIMYLVPPGSIILIFHDKISSLDKIYLDILYIKHIRMISFNQNKFKSPPDNSFGRLPAQDKLFLNVTNGTSLCLLAPVQIREFLGIIEEEYYQKYYVNPNIIRCVPEMDISGSLEYATTNGVVESKESVIEGQDVTMAVQDATIAPIKMMGMEAS